MNKSVAWSPCSVWETHIWNTLKLLEQFSTIARYARINYQLPGVPDLTQKSYRF